MMNILPPAGITSSQAKCQPNLQQTHSIPQGARIYLVVHSIGYLVAQQLPPEVRSRISGVIAIDPAHPRELALSTKQEAGAKTLTQYLDSMAAWSKLGFTKFLEAPAWVHSLPTTAARAFISSRRAGRYWRTGVSEWRAALQVLEKAPYPVAWDQAACLIVMSGRTLELDELNESIFTDLLAYFPAGRSRAEVISGADHNNIVSNFFYARQVCSLIDDFIEADGGFS